MKTYPRSKTAEAVLVCLVAVISVFSSAQELVPGEPQNLQVVETGVDFVRVTYNDPVVHPESVDIYGITWIKVKDSSGEKQKQVSVKRSNAICDPVCENTISPLPACSNIMVAVAASNPSGTIGPPAYVETATNDSAPIELPSVEAEALSPTVIRVTWTGNPEDECASEVTICWIDRITEVEHCDDVLIVEGEGGGGAYNITDVLPCNRYDITVTAKSPTGLRGTTTRLSQFTQDIQPSPVTDLTIKDVGITDVTFTFNMPTENPQCALHLEDLYIDLTNQQTSKREPSAPGASVHKDGLLACTDYLIQVRTISRSGLNSSPANVTVTTRSAITSPPRNLVPVNIQGESATLEWLTPANCSRCVTVYDLELMSESLVDEHSVIPEEEEHVKISYDLTDLSPCQSYNASVAATSEEGESELVSTTFTTLCS